MSWGETLFLKKVIEGRKRFVASDDILTSVSGSFSRNNNFISFLKFTPKLDGTLKLKLQANGNLSMQAILNIQIFKDGNLYHTWNISVPSGFQDGSFEYILNIQKSSVYELKNAININVPMNYDFYVSGNTQDSNYFKVEGV